MTDYSVGGIVLQVVKRADVGRDGDGVLNLTLEGSLYVAGTSKATLKSSYVDALNALVAIVEVVPVDGAYPRIAILEGNVVAVVSPDSRYTGNWVLTDAEFSEASAVAKYNFTLTLIQGSAHDVL